MIFDRYDPITSAFENQNGISEKIPEYLVRLSTTIEADILSDSLMGRETATTNVFDGIIDRINTEVGPIQTMDLGGEQVPMLLAINPALFLKEVSALGTLGEREYRDAAQQLFDTVNSYESDNPGSIPQEVLDLMSLDAIEEKVKADTLQAREERMQLARLPGGTGINLISGLVVGMYEMTQDPVQAVGMFVGGAGAKTLYSLAFREAVIGGAFEAARQPNLAKWYDDLGLEYTREDFFRNVGFGAAAGGAFAVGGAAVGAAYRGVSTAFGSRRKSAPDNSIDPLGSLSPKQVADGIEAMKKDGVELSSEGQAALNLAKYLVAVDETNPGLPAVVHSENLRTADLAIADGKLPPESVGVSQEAIPPQALAADQPEVDNLGGLIYSFDPRDILVDAKTFQFKGGGDEFGVTDRLRGITVWDPKLAGVVTVFEYADGRRFIADGHQRVGLARRLLSENPDADIKLYGYLMREVDGVTPEQAMVSAAVTNIAQGTGSAIDAAKIARMDADRFTKMIGKTLPPTSQLVRQARDMMVLTDDAFGAVINEVIPANYGAVVGRILADKPDLQMAAIGILSKAEPANVFQAEAIVRQVREADVDVQTQSSLFGDELVVESLYVERAKVLDRAVKQLRQDRAAFASLVRNAENIEAAGNVLDAATNQRRADLDAQAISLVQTLANRKGTLSDALSEAARGARDTGSYAGATRQFVESIRRAIGDGDFERLAHSEPGSVVYDTPPSRVSEVGKEPSLEGFDEPSGHGVAAEQQADDLTREMFPEDVPGQAPPARADEPEPATPTTEVTQAGEQMVIPGAERISDRQLAERRGAEAMRGGQEAPPEGGLFDETARAQEDLFAGADLDEEIPIGALVDDEGNVVAQTTTLRDMKTMLDEEDAFIDRLGFCTR